MGIVRNNEAPEDGLKALAEGLADIEIFDKFSDSELGGAPIDVSQPFAAYFVGLRTIERGQFIAQFVGWRYMLEHATTGAASYVDITSDDGRSRMVEVSQNENAARLISAAHVAEEHAGRNAGPSFEFRTLDVPAVKLSVVWLTTETGTTDYIYRGTDGPDIFVPYIDSLSKDIEPFVMSPTAFASELRRRAELLRSSQSRGDVTPYREL